MSAIMIGVGAAALASSLCTVGLALLLYRVRGRRRIEAELLAIQNEFERRVKSGVISAGEELLPAFRAQVALGFQDALRQSTAAGLMESTAKVVTGSTDLLADSLGNLFGLKPKK